MNKFFSGTAILAASLVLASSLNASLAVASVCHELFKSTVPTAHDVRASVMQQELAVPLANVFTKVSRQDLSVWRSAFTMADTRALIDRDAADFKVTYRFFTGEGAARLEVAPHTVSLIAEITAATRKRSLGISEAEVEMWLRATLELAALENRTVTPGLAMTAFRTLLAGGKFKRAKRPDTKDLWNQHVDRAMMDFLFPRWTKDIVRATLGEETVNRETLQRVIALVWPSREAGASLPSEIQTRFDLLGYNKTSAHEALGVIAKIAMLGDR